MTSEIIAQNNNATNAIIKPHLDVLTAQNRISETLAHVNVIHKIMREAMRDGVHYGPGYPGDNKKTLKKPGADLLAVAFKFVPKFEVKKENLIGDHREYFAKCRIYTALGTEISNGVGSCSTMESKYRYRKFNNSRIENKDLADLWNVCLKMAKKRAYVDAIITATSASDCFTQDVEMDEDEADTELKNSRQSTINFSSAKNEPAPAETEWADELLEKNKNLSLTDLTDEICKSLINFYCDDKKSNAVVNKLLEQQKNVTQLNNVYLSLKKSMEKTDHVIELKNLAFPIYQKHLKLVKAQEGK